MWNLIGKTKMFSSRFECLIWLRTFYFVSWYIHLHLLGRHTQKWETISYYNLTVLKFHVQLRLIIKQSTLYFDDWKCCKQNVKVLFQKYHNTINRISIKHTWIEVKNWFFFPSQKWNKNVSLRICLKRVMVFQTYPHNYNLYV